jgi:hypothetical protein
VRAADGAPPGRRARICGTGATDLGGSVHGGVTVAVLALAAVCVASCSPSERSTGAPPKAPAATRPAVRISGRAGLDPCSLLAPREVEVALGALAGPPYLAAGRNDPIPRCVYEGRDLRSIELTLVSAGGGDALRRMHPQLTALRGGLVLPDGSLLRGSWDAAAIDGCCRVAALRADTLVSIDVLGSRATLEQAAELIGRALRRIDEPLPIAGSAGIAAAHQREAARPVPMPRCGVLTRREVEALLGPLAADPEAADRGTATACVYRLSAAARPANPGVATIRYSVQWRGGYRAFRHALAPPAGGGLLQEANGPDRLQPEGGSWEQVAADAERVLAVKRDVLVTVEAEMFLGRAEHTQELAAAIIDRIR